MHRRIYNSRLSQLPVEHWGEVVRALVVAEKISGGPCRCCPRAPRPSLSSVSQHKPYNALLPCCRIVSRLYRDSPVQCPGSAPPCFAGMIRINLIECFLSKVDFLGVFVCFAGLRIGGFFEEFGSSRLVHVFMNITRSKILLSGPRPGAGSCRTRRAGPC